MTEQVYCHQTGASCPMVHHQPRQEQLTRGTGWFFQKIDVILCLPYCDSRQGTAWRYYFQSPNKVQYLALTIASIVSRSCGLNCPDCVSTLRVTYNQKFYQSEKRINNQNVTLEKNFADNHLMIRNKRWLKSLYIKLSLLIDRQSSCPFALKKTGDWNKGKNKMIMCSPTCPSAIIRRTWYWPPVLSTIPIAVSIIGAKDVGPVTKLKLYTL